MCPRSLLVRVRGDESRSRYRRCRLARDSCLCHGLVNAEEVVEVKLDFPIQGGMKPLYSLWARGDPEQMMPFPHRLRKTIFGMNPHHVRRPMSYPYSDLYIPSRNIKLIVKL